MEELYTIYKISSKDNKYTYIGSTKDLDERISKHRQNSNNQNSRKYNYKIYKTIRDNGGWSEFIIEKIEDILCNQEIAFKRETELMKEFNSNLNCNRAYISPDDIKKQRREYNLKNKEKRKIQRKEYRLRKLLKKFTGESNCEETKVKSINSFKCYCGGNYTNKHKSEHFKSDKHLKHENSTTNNITINITNLTINN